MKIAQIAPLMESVPPRLYGGTERIVSYLTDELVRLGHEVTLFASADSISAAELVSCASMALRLDRNVRDPIPYYMLMLDRVRELAEEFDILHFHIDQFHFPLFRQMADRTVTTLHGRQDLPDLKPLYLGFSEMPLVSISNDQRRPIANANFVATVHHGIPANLHTPIFNPRGGYVAFLGRISPEKRPDRAIAIARTLGIPLKIAAKVDKVDEAYFRETIAPLLSDPGVEFIGEINERSKSEFLGEALALLFPVDWPEPFGLVMIEAMACGTPVLAFRRGSVSEIIDQGVTGAVVDTMDEAVRMLPQVLALDRHAVRRRFEQRFSSARMATDYVALYRSLLQRPSISERETIVPLPPGIGKKVGWTRPSRRSSAPRCQTEAALMPASSHPASHPNQDSYADGDSESDQRAVLDLAGDPVQSVVAELGGFVAETRGLVAGQAPAAAKAIDDFGHGRDDGVTDMIAGRRHAGRSMPAGRLPDSLKLVLKGA
jgi:glycosyltransferase involved in cell wall biosynthesis